MFTGLVQAVGTAVTDVVAGVAGDPALQAIVGQQVAGYVSAALAGTPVSGLSGTLTGVLVGLISNEAVTGGLADVAGTVLVDFLGQPGIATVLADIGGGLATALLAGTDQQAALQTAWLALQADSAFVPAVAASVTTASSRPKLRPTVSEVNC
jgi:hypothetical protein